MDVRLADDLGSPKAEYLGEGLVSWKADLTVFPKAVQMVDGTVAKRVGLSVETTVY